MRILFCNDSYPGNFEKLAAALAADSSHKVLFMSMYARRAFSLPGVSRVRLKVNRDRNLDEKEHDPFFSEWEKTVRTGRYAFRTLCTLRSSGFVPDMILSAAGSGVSMFLRRAFPESFLVSYLEPYRRSSVLMSNEDRYAAVLSIQSLQMVQSDLCMVFSDWQKRKFSYSFRSCIRTRSPMVDTDLFSRQAAEPLVLSDVSSKELVSFSMKGTRQEIGRELWPVIIGLLSIRSECHVVLSFGNDEEKIHWAHFCSKLPDSWRTRLTLTGFLSITEYRDLICASTIHVCPEAIEPPLQEMLETLSCETLLLTPLSKSTGMLQDGRNMLMFPHNKEEQFKTIVYILDHYSEYQNIRQEGRRLVKKYYSMDVTMPEHIAMLQKEYTLFRAEQDAVGVIKKI
jgi:hypothetical protein